MRKCVGLCISHLLSCADEQDARQNIILVSMGTAKALGKVISDLSEYMATYNKCFVNGSSTIMEELSSEEGL